MKWKKFNSVFSPLAIVFLLVSLTINTTSFTQTISGHTEIDIGAGENGESKIIIPIVSSGGTIISPQLEISYSSQGNDGILGQGFALSGVYAITRVSATKSQDGFVDDIDFDNNDRFALNGERLMVVSGSYGDNNANYKTEQNNHSKIVSYGTSGVGPEKFKVWTKDGLVLEFGYSEDSKIEAQGKASILVWLVTKVTDRKGNYMTFSYEENNANSEYRPLRIDYTGNTNLGLLPYNSIRFVYENRTDTISKYLSGSKLDFLND